MSTATITNQVVAKMHTRIGLLADVAGAVRGAGVNIQAICAYEQDHMGYVMFLSDDNARAAEAVAGLGADVEVSREAVISVALTDEPGALETESRKIADAGYNIDYVYGGAGGGSATVVFALHEVDAAAAALG